MLQVSLKLELPPGEANAECFISFARRRWGAKVWIQAEWCEFSFRKSGSQHYFITLLVQLWRNTFLTPHWHAFLLRTEALKPVYNFILSVGFMISLLKYAIICISWSSLNSSYSSPLLFLSLPWKLVGAFGRHSNKTELFLSHVVGCVGTSAGPRVLIASEHSKYLFKSV